MQRAGLAWARPLIAGLLGLAALAGAPAEAGLRCGNQLVDVGDRAFQVLRACGEPLFVDEWQVGAGFGILPFSQEEWFYDFSSRSLTRMLRFRNGRLVRIETGGYGFGGACAPNDITRGLSKLELLVRCGLPESREGRTEFRTPRGRFFQRPHRRLAPALVHVEEWVYAFGPRRLIRFVTLIDSRVVRVETGERLN